LFSFISPHFFFGFLRLLYESEVLQSPLSRPFDFRDTLHFTGPVLQTGPEKENGGRLT
jgi:hypothetical protein